jgi:hypothetical protein
MNIKLLEQDLVDLLSQGKFDEAEVRKREVVSWLIEALAKKTEEANQCLVLFSELAGDAESFDNFSTLLDDLESRKLITPDQVKYLIEASPSNRWL